MIGQHEHFCSILWGQLGSWLCLPHWSLDWQPASFCSRKGHLGLPCRLKLCDLSWFFSCRSVQFPDSLGSHLCDVRLRVRLWPHTVFPKQCDSVPSRAACWAQLSLDFGSYSLAKLQPQPQHHSQRLLGTMSSSLPFQGGKGTFYRSHIYSWASSLFPYLHQASWGRW